MFDRKVKELKERGERGDPAAWWRLGLLYLDGCGDPEERLDAACAFEWFLKAAEDGSGPALRKLALLCLEGRGTEVREKDAFGYMLRAAKAYDPDSFYDLGILYRDGKGVESDPEAAKLWLTRAAETGCSKAYLPLSELLCEDGSDSVEREEAVHWLESAADGGQPGANFRLAELFKGMSGDCHERRMRRLAMAADEGDSRAHLELAGEALAAGRSGALMNARIRGWLEDYVSLEAAPVPWALRELGLAHAGSGGDPGKAAKALERAADLGDGEAALALAGLLSEGRGVRRNLGKAFRLVRKAAEDGSPEAQFKLSGMCLEGSGTARSPKAAFRWMLKAAESGHEGAMRELSRMYRLGVGVKRDLRSSADWKARRSRDLAAGQAQGPA
jgi:TPR repeat protein